MAVAVIAISLLLVPTVTFILVFSIYQITFAQSNETQGAVPQSSLDTVIAGIVSGGIIGAAASLIGTFLNNRHNMNVKRQELKHGLDIELLKHRIECYSTAFKLTDRTTAVDLTLGEIQTLYDQLKSWFDQEKGALLMSEDSRKEYFFFRGVIGGILDSAVDSAKTGVDPIIEFTTPKTRLNLHESSGDFIGSLLRDVGVREQIPKS